MLQFHEEIIAANHLLNISPGSWVPGNRTLNRAIGPGGKPITIQYENAECLLTKQTFTPL